MPNEELTPEFARKVAELFNYIGKFRESDDIMEWAIREEDRLQREQEKPKVRKVLIEVEERELDQVRKCLCTALLTWRIVEQEPKE